MSTYTPSCLEDFTGEWLLFVLQQYYRNNYGQTIHCIGEFRTEKCESDNDSKPSDGAKLKLHKEESEAEHRPGGGGAAMAASGGVGAGVGGDSGSDSERDVAVGAAGAQDDMDEEEEVHSSQHILSQAYRVMVDVPDPPKNCAEDKQAKSKKAEHDKKVGRAHTHASFRFLNLSLGVFASLSSFPLARPFSRCLSRAPGG